MRRNLSPSEHREMVIRGAQKGGRPTKLEKHCTRWCFSSLMPYNHKAFHHYIVGFFSTCTLKATWSWAFRLHGIESKVFTLKGSKMTQTTTAKCPIMQHWTFSKYPEGLPAKSGQTLPSSRNHLSAHTLLLYKFVCNKSVIRAYGYICMMWRKKKSHFSMQFSSPVLQALIMESFWGFQVTRACSGNSWGARVQAKIR